MADRFLPALRFRTLTRLYDPVVRVSTRERAFKSALVRRAAARPGERVLDVGSGTGTLAIAIGKTEPLSTVEGIDADPEMIDRARSKAASAGLRIGFTQALSNDLPFDDGRFDIAVSSLFFHHLAPEIKVRTAGEVARVLRSGGRFVVADWDAPQDPLMHLGALGIRILDGFERTRQSLGGKLPGILADAGLLETAEVERFRTPLGTLSLRSFGRS